MKTAVLIVHAKSEN